MLILFNGCNPSRKKSYLWYKSKWLWSWDNTIVFHLVVLSQRFHSAFGLMELQHQSYLIRFVVLSDGHGVLVYNSNSVHISSQKASGLWSSAFWMFECLLRIIWWFSGEEWEIFKNWYGPSSIDYDADRKIEVNCYISFLFTKSSQIVNISKPFYIDKMSFYLAIDIEWWRLLEICLWGSVEHGGGWPMTILCRTYTNLALFAEYICMFVPSPKCDWLLAMELHNTPCLYRSAETPFPDR